MKKKTKKKRKETQQEWYAGYEAASKKNFPGEFVSFFIILNLKQDEQNW